MSNVINLLSDDEDSSPAPAAARVALVLTESNPTRSPALSSLPSAAGSRPVELPSGHGSEDGNRGEDGGSLDYFSEDSYDSDYMGRYDYSANSADYIRFNGASITAAAPSSSSRGGASSAASARTITLTAAQYLARLPKGNGEVLDLTADSDDDAQRSSGATRATVNSFARYAPAIDTRQPSRNTMSLPRNVAAPPPNPNPNTLPASAPTSAHVSAAAQHVAKVHMEKKRKADESGGTLTPAKKPTIRAKVKKEFQTEPVPFGTADCGDDVVEVDDPDAQEIGDKGNATAGSSSDIVIKKQNSDDDDMLEIVGTGGNMLGLMDMPHQREACCMHKFTIIDMFRACFMEGNFVSTPETNSNISVCSQCYCFVCDVIASQCVEWDFHCHAYYKSAVWKKEKDSRKSPLFKCMSQPYFLRFYAINRLYFIGYIADGVTFEDCIGHSAAVLQQNFYRRFMLHVQTVANAELAARAQPTRDSLVSIAALVLLAFKYSMHSSVSIVGVENMAYLMTTFTQIAINKLLDSETKNVMQSEAAALFQLNGHNKSFMAKISCNPHQVLVAIRSHETSARAWYRDEPPSGSNSTTAVPHAVSNAPKPVLKIIVSALIHNSCDRAVFSLLIKSPDLIMGSCIAYLGRQDDQSHLNAVALAQLARVHGASTAGKAWLDTFHKQIYSKHDDDSLEALPASRLVFFIECLIREDGKLRCGAIVGKILKALEGMLTAVAPTNFVNGPTMRNIFSFLSNNCPLNWIHDKTSNLFSGFGNSKDTMPSYLDRTARSETFSCVLSAVAARVLLSPSYVKLKQLESKTPQVEILPLFKSVLMSLKMVTTVMAVECLVDDTVSESSISEFEIKSIQMGVPHENVTFLTSCVRLSRAATMCIACRIGRELITRVAASYPPVSTSDSLCYLNKKVILEWADLQAFQGSYPHEGMISCVDSASFNALTMSEFVQLTELFAKDKLKYFKKQIHPSKVETPNSSKPNSKDRIVELVLVQTAWKSFCASYYLNAFGPMASIQYYKDLLVSIKNGKFKPVISAMTKLRELVEPVAAFTTLTQPLEVIQQLSEKCKHMLRVQSGPFSAVCASLAVLEVNSLRSVIGSTDATRDSSAWKFWRHVVSNLMKAVLGGEKTVSTVYLSIGDWDSVFKYLDNAVDCGLFLSQLPSVPRSDITCLFDAQMLSKFLVQSKSKYVRNVHINQALKDLASDTTENVLDSTLEHSPLSCFNIFEAQPSSALLNKICEQVRVVQRAIDENKMCAGVLFEPEFAELREVIRRTDEFRVSLEARVKSESKAVKNTADTFLINTHVRDVEVKADEAVSLYILGMYDAMALTLQAHFPYLAVIGTRAPTFIYSVADNPFEPYHRVNIANDTIRAIITMEIAKQQHSLNPAVLFTILDILLPWLSAWFLTSNTAARACITAIIGLISLCPAGEPEQGHLLTCELNLYLNFTHENMKSLYELASTTAAPNPAAHEAAKRAKERVTALIPKFFEKRIISDVAYIHIACAFFERGDVIASCNAVGSSLVRSEVKDRAAGVPSSDHNDQLKEVVLRLLELSTKEHYDHYRYIFFCRISKLITNFSVSFPNEVRDRLREVLVDDLIDKINSGGAAASKGGLCFEGGGFWSLGDTAKMIRLVVSPSLDNYSSCSTCKWFDDAIPLLASIVKSSTTDLVKCLPVFISAGHFADLFTSIFDIVGGIYSNLVDMHTFKNSASPASPTAREGYDKCFAIDAQTKQVIGTILDSFSSQLNLTHLAHLLNPSGADHRVSGLPASQRMLHYLFKTDCPMVLHSMLRFIVVIDGLVSESNNSNNIPLIEHFSRFKAAMTLLLSDQSVILNVFQMCTEFSYVNISKCALAVSTAVRAQAAAEPLLNVAGARQVAIQTRINKLFETLFAMLIRTPCSLESRFSKFTQVCRVQDSELGALELRSAIATIRELQEQDMHILLKRVLMGVVLPQSRAGGGALASAEALVRSLSDHAMDTTVTEHNATVTEHNAAHLLIAEGEGGIIDRVVTYIGDKMTGARTAARSVEAILLLAMSSQPKYSSSDIKGLTGYAAAAKGGETSSDLTLRMNSLREGIDLLALPFTRYIIDVISCDGASPDFGYLHDVKKMHVVVDDDESIARPDYTIVSNALSKMIKSNQSKGCDIRKNAGNLLFKVVLVKMVTEAFNISCFLSILSLEGLGFINTRDDCSPALSSCVEFAVAKNLQSLEGLFTGCVKHLGKHPIVDAIFAVHSQDPHQQVIKPLSMLPFEKIMRALFFEYDDVNGFKVTENTKDSLVMDQAHKLEHVYRALLRANKCRDKIKGLGDRVLLYLKSTNVTKQIGDRFAHFCNAYFRALQLDGLDLWSDFIARARASLMTKTHCKTVLNGLQQPGRLAPIYAP